MAGLKPGRVWSVALCKDGITPKVAWKAGSEGREIQEKTPYHGGERSRSLGLGSPV